MGEEEGELAQLERVPGATPDRDCPSLNTLRNAEAKRVKNQADHKAEESGSITEWRELGWEERLSF